MLTAGILLWVRWDDLLFGDEVGRDDETGCRTVCTLTSIRSRESGNLKDDCYPCSGRLSRLDRVYFCWWVRKFYHLTFFIFNKIRSYKTPLNNMSFSIDCVG